MLKTACLHVQVQLGGKAVFLRVIDRYIWYSTWIRKPHIHHVILTWVKTVAQQQLMYS